MRGYLNSQAAVAFEKGSPDNQSVRVASIKRHRRQQATVFVFPAAGGPQPCARPSKELTGRRHVVVLCEEPGYGESAGRITALLGCVPAKWVSWNLARVSSVVKYIISAASDASFMPVQAIPPPTVAAGMR